MDGMPFPILEKWLERVSRNVDWREVYGSSQTSVFPRADPKLRALETRSSDAQIVFLSDVHLDVPKVRGRAGDVETHGSDNTGG